MISHDSAIAGSQLPDEKSRGGGILSWKVCLDKIAAGKCRTWQRDELVNMTHHCECNPTHKCVKGLPLEHFMQLQFPDFEVYKKIYELEFDYYKRFFRPQAEFLDGCVYRSVEDHACYNIKTILSPYQYPYVSNCATYNSLDGSPDSLPEQHINLKAELMINFEISDPYLYPKQEFEGYVVVHNYRQLVNPFVKGFRVNLNRFLDLTFRKVVHILLPYPYETNCQDYLTEWKARGNTGPTNQEECSLECEKNTSLSLFGCVSHEVKIPGNMRRCYAPMTEEGRRKIKECVNNCKPACYDIKYDIAADAAPLAEVFRCQNRTELPWTYRYAVIRLSLVDMKTTTIKAIPMYEPIEVFSYLGNYLGVWFGISMVVLFDIIESFSLILAYPFRSTLGLKMKETFVTYIHRI